MTKTVMSRKTAIDFLNPLIESFMRLESISGVGNIQGNDVDFTISIKKKGRGK